MTAYKGANNIMALEQLFASRDPALEKRFLQSLTAEELGVYNKILRVSWISVEIGTSLLEKAADILLPDDPDKLRNLGRIRAQTHIKGLDKVLLRILSVPSLISKAAQIWTTLYNQGTASVAKKGKNSQGENTAIFTVVGYDYMPLNMRKIIGGYIEGLVELTGVKSVRVELASDDSPDMKWFVYWK